MDGQKMTPGRALESLDWRESRGLPPLIRVIPNSLTLGNSPFDRWEKAGGNTRWCHKANFFQNQSLLVLVTLENPPPPITPRVTNPDLS